MRRNILRFVYLSLAVVAIAAIVLITVRTDVLSKFYEAWRSLDPEMRELVQFGAMVVLGVLTIIFMFLIAKRSRRLQREQERILKDELAFPFEVFSSLELDKLRRGFLGQGWDIKYLPRFTQPKQQNFEEKFNAEFLLLSGRAGLGKTRECIEMIGRLAAQKGEEVTVLCPSGYIDRPANVPAEVQRARTVILLIDDIHQQCVATPRAALEPETRTYHERLADTIQWVKTQFKGRDFRVVITAGDEPDLRKRLKLEAQFWKPFKEYQLPGVHRDARPQFINGMAKHFNLSLEKEAVDYIVEKSDGTCAGIVTALRRESSKHDGKPAKVTVKDLQDYKFRYPFDWEEQVYKKSIKPFPARTAVFEALAVLHDLRVPSHSFLVVSLASHLWRGGLGLIKRRRIMQAIRHDLRAWIFEYKGELICPAAYLEGKASLKDALPKLVRCVKRAVRRREQLEKLLPGLIPVAYGLGDQFGYYGAAVEILEAAATRAGNSSPLWVALAVTYARLGRHKQSLKASQRAVSADQADPRAHIALAYALSLVGERSRAILTSREATSIAPTYYFSWLNLGVLLSKAGEHDEAIDALQRACGLNPENAKAWYSLGVAFDRKGESEKSIEACLQATTLDPFEPTAWHSLGITYDRKGESEKAIRALERARDLDDSQATTWLSLGRAYLKASRQEEALRTLSGVEERAGKDASLYLSLSRVYGITGFHDQAVKMARKAVEIDPGLADAWQSLSINLTNLGKPEEAAEAQKKVAELTGKADEWYNASRAYGKAEQYKEAVKAARKALKIDATLSVAWRSLVINLQILGKAQEALEAQRKLAELTGEAREWYRASVGYGKAGRYQEAVETAGKAVEIDSTFADAWRSLAMNLEYWGKPEEANDARRKVKELTGEADKLYRASVGYGKAGRYQEAVEAAGKAVEIDSTFADAWRSLAMNLEQLGRGEEAIAALRKLYELTGEMDYRAEVEAAIEEVNRDPKSPNSWRKLALRLKCVGECEKAISTAVRKLNESPEISGAVLPVVEECLNLLPRETIDLLELLVKLEAGNSELWHLLGVARRKAGYLKEALEAGSEALRIDPGQHTYWYALGRAHEELKQIKEAKAAYKHAAELGHTKAGERLSGLT